MIGSSWIVEDLLRVEDLIVRTVGATEHPLVREPSLHLIKAGGKRLRPALVLLSAHAGTPGREETDLAAAAVELVHLATLYHDDVIDETDIRRGVPTVAARWGTEVAVLTGDYLFACACMLGARAGGEVPMILARALADVCEGQIAETAALDGADRPQAEYIDTIAKKTGALFRAACDLGAATSGASGQHREALVYYGERLALAFQIVDDLLDLVGDPEITGKNKGTDLKEGVFTLPVLIAHERESSLGDLLAGGERSLDTILPILESTGALRDAVEVAAGHAEAARKALEWLPESEWRSSLEMIVQGVLAQVPNAPELA